jgi:hypothetical protein
MKKLEVFDPAMCCSTGVADDLSTRSALVPWFATPPVGVTGLLQLLDD